MADSLETEAPPSGGSASDAPVAETPRPAPALPPLPAYDDPDLWEQDDPDSSRDEPEFQWTPLDLERFPDMRWITDQLHDGAFIGLEGDWIAVAHERLLGHGKDRDEVRSAAATSSGVPIERIVTQYIWREEDFNWKW